MSADDLFFGVLVRQGKRMAPPSGMLSECESNRHVPEKLEELKCRTERLLLVVREGKKTKNAKRMVLYPYIE